MKAIMHKLLRHEDLTQNESYQLISQLSSQSAERQGAILALLASKGETLDELLGAHAYLFSQRTRVPCDLQVIDIAGTGGDGIGTFNISTITSLVVASCGVKIAKHGGRSASSDMGSADLMESLNIQANADPVQISCDLAEKNYAYLFAPLFNPMLTKLATTRKNLSMPTLFNSLCPLLNPINPQRQLLGINNKQHLRLFAELTQRLGKERAMIVHAEDGLDELSISAKTFVAELRDGKIIEYCLAPEDAGLTTAPLSDVIVTNKEDKTKVILDILTGKMTGAKLDIVLMNSAAALLIADRVNNLRDGVKLARQAIQSGRTLQLLSQLQRR